MDRLIEQVREVDVPANTVDRSPSGSTPDPALTLDGLVTPDTDSAYCLMTHLAPHMSRRRPGVVVNTYNMSDTGTDDATASLASPTTSRATEVAASGLRVNTVTSQVGRLLESAERPGEPPPAGREAIARGVAEAVAFLASEKADLITGVLRPEHAEGRTRRPTAGRTVEPNAAFFQE